MSQSHKTKTPRQYILLSLKGVAMGAADVVPGVSGGTIAFITGIYDELLSSINSINLKALKVLTSEGIKAFWKHINGNFLVFLLLGIGLSIASLAKLISYLMDEHAIGLWSFFFGLVSASIFYVAQQVSKWNFATVIGFILGAVFAYYITEIPPMQQSGELWFIFVSGLIAICAMILPGISGSFILLILGSYEIIINAIKSINISIMAVFATGCVIGLLSFSRVLKWLLDKHRNLTIAVLSGFLLGSLNKIWPWKVNVGAPLYTHSNGKVEYITENISPYNFEGDNQFIIAVSLILVGFLLIFGMEYVAKKLNPTKQDNAKLSQ
jgi:putative membrane protein